MGIAAPSTCYRGGRRQRSWAKYGDNQQAAPSARAARAAMARIVRFQVVRIGEIPLSVRDQVCRKNANPFPTRVIDQWQRVGANAAVLCHSAPAGARSAHPSRLSRSSLRSATYATGFCLRMAHRRPRRNALFCFLGSWAFSALVTWVWLFVGSARRDAESQIVGMLVLIFAFGAAALLSSAAMLRLHSMRLRWRGGVIRWLSAGREVTQQMSDFEAWRLPWSGLLHLRFEDGTDLKLDTYARNAEALAVAINERSGRRLDLL